MFLLPLAYHEVKSMKRVGDIVEEIDANAAYYPINQAEV